MSEQETFEEEDLKAHRNALHVKCNVCTKFFYDGSQLIAHIKTQHHFCEFCPPEKRLAYLDYRQLEAHYKQAHYFCSMFECKQSQHIVFVKYEDFREHYRMHHPGVNAPPPEMGFRVNAGEEDGRNNVFVDNPGKGEKNPKMDNRRIEMDFPALAPPKSERRILDYSRVINKPPANVWVQPQNFPRAYNYGGEERRPKTASKKTEKKNYNNPSWEVQNSSERKQSPVVLNDTAKIERAFERINAGEMTVDEFVGWFRSERFQLDNSMVTAIRSKILSNSDREKIIYVLQSPSKNNKKNEGEFKNPAADFPYYQSFPTEHVKVEIKQNRFEEFEGRKQKNPYFLEENEEEKRIPHFQPMIYPSPQKKPNLPEHITSTLAENIMILNSGLIDNKIFVTSLLAFVPQTDIETVLMIIRERITPETRATAIIKEVKDKMKETPMYREYPPLPSQKSINYSMKAMIARPVPAKKTPEKQEYIAPTPVQKTPAKYENSLPTPVQKNIAMYESTLRENISFLNSGLISLRELAAACVEIIPPEDISNASAIIRQLVTNKSSAENIIKEMDKLRNSKNANKQNNFKVVNLPPEPKQSRNRK